MKLSIIPAIAVVLAAQAASAQVATVFTPTTTLWTSASNYQFTVPTPTVHINAQQMSCGNGSWANPVTGANGLGLGQIVSDIPGTPDYAGANELDHTYVGANALTLTTTGAIAVGSLYTGNYSCQSLTAEFNQWIKIRVPAHRVLIFQPLNGAGAPLSIILTQGWGGPAIGSTSMLLPFTAGLQAGDYELNVSGSVTTFLNPGQTPPGTLLYNFEYTITIR